jgi:thioredoxin 1
MKEILIIFIAALIIGAAINGYNNIQSQTPEPKNTSSDNNPLEDGNNTTDTAAGENATGNTNTGGTIGDAVRTANANAITAKELTDSSFTDTVLKANTPVLVDFYATWCGPCKRMSPVIEQIAQEYSDKAKVYKVNVDANPLSAEKYNITSIPHFIVFKNGQMTDSFVGGQAKTTLTEAIDKQLN